MSTKKISNYEADAIAKVIANKAFAHLTKTYREKLENLAMETYRHVETLFDLNLLVEMNFGYKANSIAIDVLNSAGQCHTVWTKKFEVAVLVNTPAYGNIKLVHEHLFDQIDDVLTHLNPINEKRNALQKELAAQLSGKTINQACKAWPEAADIIKAHFDITSEPMTTPLEELLARFLPMLPAPTEG